MFRHFWVPVLAAAVALFFVSRYTAPTTVYAAANKDMQELQRDVAQLQDMVKSLQRSQDEKFAALQVLVQQSVNVANDANKSVAVIQSSLQQSLRDQEGKVVAPVVGLGGRMDSMSNDFRGLQNSVSDLTALINKMQTQLSDIKDTLKVMQTPPPAPPPAAGAAPVGTGGAASAPPLPASDLYTNAEEDRRAGHADLALQEYGDYLKYYGNTALAPNAQFYVGLVHYNQGSFETAAQDFDAVLERYPTDNARVPQAFYYKGMSLLKLDQKTKAGEEFRQLIDKFPDHDLAKQACTELKGMGLRCAAPAKAPAKRPAGKK
ncbi:MAG: tetratricopeptide repeat protein [Bryobacteraceae bacterium]|jgi:TolA-binding protein